MHKILTIAQREYTSRVFTKIFWVSVILAPLGMAMLIIIPVLASRSVEEEKAVVRLIDPSGRLLTALGSRKDTTITYVPDTMSYAQFMERKKSGQMKIKKGEILLAIDTTSLDSPNVVMHLVVNGKPSLQVSETISSDMRSAIVSYRLKKLGVVENPLRFGVNLSQSSVDETGKLSDGDAGIATLLGYGMSFLNYMMVFIYGVMVMRGVIEEKTSRIVEVILSSVKPYQLMAGKLIGICAVGLTQFILWIALSLGVSYGIGQWLASSDPVAAGAAAGTSSGDLFFTVISLLSPGLLVSFAFYFLGGFLLFGSLFAAIGSAVDQEQDAQQLMWPVTIPLIIPMLLLGNVLLNPNGSLAVFMSIFPISSPTIMMVRLAATDVPLWQLALSMLSLVASIVFCLWLAARIYRTGILLYGKRITMKEIARWIVRS